jgi:hypothetical protein
MKNFALAACLSARFVAPLLEVLRWNQEVVASITSDITDWLLITGLQN